MLLVTEFFPVLEAKRLPQMIDPYGITAISDRALVWSH